MQQLGEGSIDFHHVQEIVPMVCFDSLFNA